MINLMKIAIKTLFSKTEKSDVNKDIKANDVPVKATPEQTDWKYYDTPTYLRKGHVLVWQ